MKGFSIKKLVRKITKSDFNLNTSLNFMGVDVHCQSGTVDYVDVSAGSLFNFSFDFWTKELIIFYIDNSKMKKSLIEEFKTHYNTITVVDQSEDE